MTFVFKHTATTETYTLSLHDALPIFLHGLARGVVDEREDGVHGLPQRFGGAPTGEPLRCGVQIRDPSRHVGREDRKSTRLNSSHANISYAVFCLKKKNNKKYKNTTMR